MDTLDETVNLEGKCRLENWSVVRQFSDYYQAPEAAVIQLSGQVYNHPVERHFDGKVVVTSPVTEVNGRVVKTCNNTYVLGEPSPEFVEWCRANGAHVPTAECPIKTA